jgi:flagellar motor switch protein FliG
MTGLNLSVDMVVEILSNTDSYVLEEILERLVESDPGTAYVIQYVLNNLEKEMA